MADLRRIPQVDALSREPALQEFPERVRVRAARRAVVVARERAREGVVPDALALAIEHARALSESSLTRVINLSGVVLHTGLGRARLSSEAADALARVASGHAQVELDLESGERGDRQAHVRDLLCELTGAGAALVVNNAAAALFLTLRALAQDGEVLLSRGEMVEIGGSFRVPDIVRESGCRLVELGCTNRTRLSDYESAITSETRVLLRCHTSNYRIVGFTGKPSLRELAELAERSGLVLVHDQGTGCLVDTTQFGLEALPTVRESLRAGAHVTIASCDKLLGGPQAGMILARDQGLLEHISSHPLARAVRVDKLTLAALEATLKAYADGREPDLPTWRAIARPLEEVDEMARRLAKACALPCEVADGLTEIGGGSAPGMGVPTRRVGILAANPDELARALRTGRPAIVGRIERDRVWLDPRTLAPEELEEVECRLQRLT